MKTLKILSLFTFALLFGIGLAIATNTPQAFFIGPALIAADQLCRHFSGFSISGMLGVVNLANILKNLPNGNNQGGTSTLFKYFLWDDVQSWPTLGTTDLEGLATCSGNVTMKAGKYMYLLEGTMNSCQMDIEQVGEIDGASFKITITIFHPGLQKKILGFLSLMKNENLGMIAADREGQRYLIGNALLPVKMVPGGTGGTGAKTEDRKGQTLKFEWYCNAVQVYSGTETSGSGA